MYGDIQLSKNRLSCMLEIDGSSSFFPINHINLLKRKKLFQVETGPILIKDNKKTFPAFIFFNSTDLCYLVPYYPGLTEKPIKRKMMARFFVDV